MWIVSFDLKDEQKGIRQQNICKDQSTDNRRRKINDKELTCWLRFGPDGVWPPSGTAADQKWQGMEVGHQLRGSQVVD